MCEHAYTPRLRLLDFHVCMKTREKGGGGEREREREKERKRGRKRERK